MPFRAKMKRALGRTNSSSTGSDLTQTETSKSSKSKKPKKEKLPDNVYKPGEAMPRLKYRGPVNKEHEANLKAFSFGDILKRRRSTATGNSDISPMGSRVMSRRGSAWSKRSKLGSRQNSGFKDVEEGELDDESHVENVGLSKQNTAENRRPGGRRIMENGPIGGNVKQFVPKGDVDVLDSQTMITSDTNGRLFTEDELAKAMTQSTLKPSQVERV